MQFTRRPDINAAVLRCATIHRVRWAWLERLSDWTALSVACTAAMQSSRLAAHLALHSPSLANLCLETHLDRRDGPLRCTGLALHEVQTRGLVARQDRIGRAYPHHERNTQSDFQGIAEGVAGHLAWAAAFRAVRDLRHILHVTYSEMYLRTLFSTPFGVKRPFRTNRDWPSIDPEVPSSASR